MDRVGARWRSGDGPARAKEVIRALVDGGPLTSLGLEEFEGRVDLRGFPMPTPVELSSIGIDGTGVRLAVTAGMVELIGLQLKAVDLSGARLKQVRFVHSEIEDCRFDEANCRELVVLGSTFKDCSFAGADLRHAALGSTWEGRRTRYDDVRFIGTRFTAAHAIEAHFKGCDFSEVELDGVNFNGSSFEECTFSGAVEDVIFYGLPPSVALEHGHDGTPNRMRGVDLRKARLRLVNFRNLELAEALLPEDDDHVVLRPYTRTLATLIDILRDDERPPAKRLLFMLTEGALRWALPDQEVGLLELRNFHDDERAVLLAAIEQARSASG